MTRRGNKARICQKCGTKLRPELRKKYDTFWIAQVLCLGAILAFYLVGLLIMAVGLWLWTRHEVYWICPACTGDRGTAD